MSNDNFFRTPNDPEGFGVTLPQRSFRSIDFSALEFDTLMEAITEYVRTYYKGEFNDFVENNGFIMMAEVVAYVGSVMSQRLDILANESFLPTSRSLGAVANHLALINQNIHRQTPATTQIMCSVPSPVATNIRIPAGFRFNLLGPDDEPLIYEMYSAPFDWESDVILPAQKFAIIGWAIEGVFADPFKSASLGGPSQTVLIHTDNIISEPMIVKIDGENWTKVDFLEQYLSNDKVFTVNITDSVLTVTFGDDINGLAPLGGQEIEVKYRVGGGSRGRIGSGIINTSSNFSPSEPVTAPVSVLFRNISPSMGGHDAESIEEAKKRAPRQWATHENIVTAADYVNTSTGFNHPVFGSVSKAVATVFTSINANVVVLNILAEGSNGTPVKPNLGLKNGLRTHLNQLNVITDDVSVEDGAIRPVDVEMVIVLNNNAESGSIKARVESTIDKFFDISNWDMGQPLYVSELYEAIMAIDGVKYVNIFKPVDDILLVNDVGTGNSTLKFNELITLGNKSIRIYFGK